ncbi:glutathione peroxidase [Ramlibacter solisilvae]|uniref:Glutathione peroxidase n=1 Tax=Ramlibacter tataouinensis TaxID=94132 RepID=A0A127JT53_9BURK|nr:glutathione peroxidase [Ramlibacter tataouinensis]AMO23110.1 glutathione peroxidase [Ramlibacter tataouinensis]
MTLANRCLALLAALLLASGAGLPARAADAPPGACPATLNHTFARLQDEKPQSLCQYAGRVLLVVNTASYCGFTPQYKGLEALYDKYKGRGLVVLGFPSNDFLQEKSSNREIAEFCENTFGVKFPMFAASHVRGSDANPLFRQLETQTGTSVKWNFYKYLIGRDGSIVAGYNSKTTPEDAALLREIEKQLAR